MVEVTKVSACFPGLTSAHLIVIGSPPQVLVQEKSGNATVLAERRRTLPVSGGRQEKPLCSPKAYAVAAIAQKSPCKQNRVIMGQKQPLKLGSRQ
jgi:hypothetical protein